MAGILLRSVKSIEIVRVFQIQDFTAALVSQYGMRTRTYRARFAIGAWLCLKAFLVKWTYCTKLLSGFLREVFVRKVESERFV